MAITGKGTYQDFGYTGGVQSITLPFTGLYKLEVWGAAGAAGYSGYYTGGGAGGYVYTYRALNKGQVLYICVGGAGQQGQYNGTGAGGYNGGGSGGGYSGVVGEGGAGGGATHISTVNGTLNSAYSGALVVAGGGGGAGLHGNGGGGGGVSSLNGIIGRYKDGVAYGNVPGPTWAGNTNPDGNRVFYTNHGVGWSGYPNHTAYACNGCGGGGGGMYGGITSFESGGSGGSGYIAVSSVTFNGVTYNSGYGGSRGGNGYARITFVDVPSQMYFDGVNVGQVIFNDVKCEKVICDGVSVYG